MSSMGMPARLPGLHTRDYLERTPDDGRRYELVDGRLFVSAAPGLVHQVALGNLFALLRQAAPPEFRVVMAPFAVALAADTELQPDLVVGRKGDYTQRAIHSPVLVVEILSASTRLYDMNTKFRRFERAGTPSFWVVDPVVRPAEASLVVWERSNEGDYRQVTKVVGDESATLDRPFPVTVTPAALVQDL